MKACLSLEYCVRVREKETPPKRRKNGGVKKDHLLGESNPCCRDENPVS
jgi:hypothetical protein